MTRHTLSIWMAALMLAACGSGAPSAPDSATQQRAETLRPTNAALAAQYERSCMACHAAGGSGAPLTGATARWQPRLAQGMEVLVKHATEGFNAMPAKGLCNDCSQADLRALIGFMIHGKDDTHASTQ
ncbi:MULTISPECIES: c-type cytochrome [Ralstonia]|uniref:C-type cytochrome n=1 Tax=Ralstonia mojiangensis TaxID=2953895 RepID=A0AAE3LAQ7_9RALS|nr:c-type cytochrome [Ralstonia mojiangensis]MCO5411005.1 c-type cytochrome [Ralstonia mojiangensis]MCT7295411.1 c-type cytochrome [Ralstonia mojiangensis]MCT7313654.1 c-type cytochrome [Ralstonia mojiangensis]MCT7316235.1 c-type cytochrome [Ralstonia mojiangensis]MCT7325396.1 c-type cytochrome [Ralstonia mojiangensis]